jgi:hypothetical protein
VKSLASVHRMISDLYPADSGAAARLSAAQVAAFHRDGYLGPVPLLDARQVEALRQGLETMLEPDYPNQGVLSGRPRLSPGERSKMIYFQGAWLAEPAFHDMVFNPRLTVPLCQLLGTTSARFFHDQMFYKPARHGGIVAWHQDYSYWTRTVPAHHMTCFIALDDSNLENGCLHVIPGSHKWNELPKVDLIGPEQDMESIKRVLTPEQLAQFKPTPIFLKAGECSFHDHYTLHGSFPNESDRPRRSVVMNYMAPDTRSASDKPLMPGAAPVPVGQVVEGELFPLVSGV